MTDLWILLAILAIASYVIWCIVKRLLYTIFYIATKAMHDAKRDD